MDLKKGWDKWLAISRVAGNFLSRILVTVFYFTIMLPFSLGVTFFSDPLKLKNTTASHWQPRESASERLEDARRQF